MPLLWFGWWSRRGKIKKKKKTGRHSRRPVINPGDFNMKLFFDKNIITLKEPDNNFIIYSPLIHKRVRISKAVFIIINDVLNNDGDVNLSKIKETISKEFKTAASDEDILSQIRYLEKLKFLFKKDTDKNELSGTVNDKIVEDIQLADLSTAYMHLTMRCNFNCSYCYNRDWHKNFRDELKTDDWAKVADKLSKTTIKHINVTGGEALVRKDAGVIIKKLAELKFRVSLLTNGSLLGERYKEVLPYVNSIVLSLDSENEHSNELNRSAIGFQNILQVIRKITKEFPDKLVVRSVITASNIDEVKEFHDKLKNEYGVKNTIKTMLIPNRIEDIAQVPELEKIKTLNDTEIGESNVYYRCSAGKKIIALSPSGDIFPCQSLMHEEFKMANIFDGDWQEKVKRSSTALMPKLLAEKKGCTDCQYKHFCGGGCPAIGYRLHGNFDHQPDFLCPHLKEQAKCRLENVQSTWETIN
ncbi:MAG: hypothetical protein A2270_07470 [Elusimicrobia bacterium RIFOXYA12_FULL_51_18]|nr:MAG: hypothetical protein A2270_07470 [Elusimicrobia bacterium RIFOXYA12_FULL_51_18]OGS28521.1 MAG: hypothetical protein A2218_05775 [Elusimicrobia bacterium RIFOXYA2_FULL_53_38]